MRLREGVAEQSDERTLAQAAVPFFGMIELLIEVVGNWAIWKSADLSPTATRRLAIALLWLCALATAGFVVALVALTT